MQSNLAVVKSGGLNRSYKSVLAEFCDATIERVYKYLYLEERDDVKLVYAIGPIIMMKNIVKLTKRFDVPTMVSLNPIMIDGTGMCGGCRVTVKNETRFCCVDGPDFDGFQVDFEELMKRNNMYMADEKDSLLFSIR